MRRNRVPRDPYWIHNRVKGATCGCGKVIAVSARAMYFPNSRKIECEDCGLKTAALLADARMAENG